MYRDNDVDYDRVEALLDGILDDVLAEVGARLDTRGEGIPIVIHNPLAWERSEPVRMTLRLNASPRRIVVRDLDGNAMPTQTFGVGR